MPTVQRAAPPAAFELIAGRLCLDFVNTVSEWPRGAHTREDLSDYGRVLDWAQCAGVLTPPGAQALRRRAQQQPAQARRAHRDAIVLRERLYRLFRSIVDGRPPEPADVEEFAIQLADAARRRRVAYRAGRFAQEWAGAQSELRSILWPVLLSAQEVLCTDDHRRLGACAAPEGCGWLYYDTSKNRSRRWCSMQTCGNTVKARRHYARSRRARAR